MIARLAGQLRCYVPERTDAAWARLRHLGARRVRLVTDATAGVQQLRDLLDCVWPAVLDAAVGAASILAETGDLARFGSPRSVVKHAGLCPRDNASGAHQGKTGISGKGRPGLRLAAWRAVWAALPNNRVLAARFRYLTTREHNRLARQQARAACAAALLRWLHVVVTGRVRWDPAIAGGQKQLHVVA